MLSRRLFVGGAVGASLGLAALRDGTARAQSVEGTVDLGGGFRVLGTGSTNVLAVPTGDGFALVDVSSAADSAGSVNPAAVLPSGAIAHTLLHTPCHPSHTGSNEPLGAE